MLNSISTTKILAMSIVAVALILLLASGTALGVPFNREGIGVPEETVAPLNRSLSQLKPSANLMPSVCVM
jgi:hypothetical protein